MLTVLEALSADKAVAESVGYVPILRQSMVMTLVGVE